MRSACSDHSQSRSALQNRSLASSVASPSLGASISTVRWQISICLPLSPSTSFRKLTTKCDMSLSCDTMRTVCLREGAGRALAHPAVTRRLSYRALLSLGCYAAFCQLGRMSAPLSLATLLLLCGSCAKARSPASVNASKLVFPVFAHRMMHWATCLRRLCFPPFGQHAQAFSSATSIAARVLRSKCSTIIVEPPPRKSSIDEPLSSQFRGIGEGVLMSRKNFHVK